MTAIIFHVQTLSCAKKQGMAGYIMPIFPPSSWMKKVLNFLFLSLSREIHWIVLMWHHWPVCYTACLAFFLLSVTTGVSSCHHLLHCIVYSAFPHRFSFHQFPLFFYPIPRSVISSSSLSYPCTSLMSYHVDPPVCAVEKSQDKRQLLWENL